MRNRGITLVVSTRRRDAKLAKSLRHYVARSGLKTAQIEILVFVNPGTQGLSSLYNQALGQAHFDGVCFLHDDLHFLRGSRWGLQVLRAFQSTDFAALSAAGSVSLGETGVFWERREHLVGRVRHRVRSRIPAKRTYFSTYSEAFDRPLPVLVLDGLFLALHRQRLYQSRPFDERFTFHFYDLAFSLQQSFAQWRSCGVLTRLRVVHHSLGEPNAAYWSLREDFIKVYRQHLPAFLRPDPLPLNTSTSPSELISLSSSSVASPPRLHVLALCDLSELMRDAPYDTSQQPIADVASHDGVWIYGSGLDPESTPTMQKRLWRQFLQGQYECSHQKLGALAPRLHYADTHLMFHNGLAFSESGVVYRGMHQPYAYTLKDTLVDAALACAVLVRGEVLQAMLSSSGSRLTSDELNAGDAALTWGVRLSIQARRMGLRVKMSGSIWGLWTEMDESP